MARTVYRISIVLHALWLLATSPAGAADPPSDASDDFDRWIPSVGLTVGFATQVHEGTVDSSEQIFAFGQPFDVPLDDRVFADDQKNSTTIQVGGTVELQTPQLLPFKWSPRIFIGGEVLNVSSQNRPIAREGNPSSLEQTAPTPFPAVAILGQGSTTISDTDNVSYGASLGVAVPIQIGDWRISIKPSARYLNQKISFRGIVLDAARTGPLGAQPPTREVVITASDSVDVHAVGPGLEIEIDAARVGPLAGSVFFSGGAYRVLSERRVAFSRSVRDNLDSGNFRGDFTAEIDPWIYRADLGFRIKWLGFSSGWLGQGK